MKRLYSLIKDADGSISVIMVILMFAFVGLLAFGIDLAHLQTVKNELQNAADACALRGARAFLPDNIPINGITDQDPNPVNARQQAQNTILVNRSDNVNFSDLDKDLPLAEVQVGIWNYETRNWVGGTSTELSWPPPASLWGHYIGPGVTLPTRRNGSVSLGSVAMTLAKLFNINTVNVSATATAALSGVGKLNEDTPGTFPIAVDETKVHAAGDIIFMSPDIPDVGGWTSLTITPASAATFKGLIDGSIKNPGVDCGEDISLQNGVACSAIKEAIKVYPATEDPKGVFTLTPPVEVTFPVVKVDKFNQTAEVVGFMTATIDVFRDSSAPKDILIPGTNPPKYTGDCMLILTAKQGSSGNLPGGGPWYGLLSTQPKLVQ